MSTMDKRQFLHQLSRIARSLREADMPKVSESLDEHKAFARCPSRRLMKSWPGGKDTSGPQLRFGVFLAHRCRRFLFVPLTKVKGGAAIEIQDITDGFERK
jgi:hypothetical protein